MYQGSTVDIVASTDGLSFYHNSTDGSVIGFVSTSTLGSDVSSIGTGSDASSIGIADPIVDSMITFDVASFCFGAAAGFFLVLVYLLIKSGCERLCKPRVEYSRIGP